MDLARSIAARRVSFEQKIAERAKLLAQEKSKPEPKPEPEPILHEKMIDALELQLIRAPRSLFSRPQWKLIAKEICAKYKVDFEDVCSEKRHKHLVLIRQEIFYRIRTDLGMSYPEIGKRFNKDHSTIIHGVRKHAARLRLEFPE